MRRAGGPLIAAALIAAFSLVGCGAQQNAASLPPCPGAAPAAARAEPLTGLAQLYFDARRAIRPVRHMAGDVHEPGTMAEGAALMPVFEQAIQLLLRATDYEALLPGQNQLPGRVASALETAWLGMGALTCELEGSGAVEARERAIGEVARDLRQLPLTLRFVLTTAIDSGATIDGAPASDDLCFRHRLHAFDRWAEFAEHLDDLILETAPPADRQATEAEIAAGDARAFTADDAAQLRRQADAAWAALEHFGRLDAPIDTLRAQLPRLAEPRPIDGEPLAMLTEAVEGVATTCDPAPRTDGSPAR